MELNQVKLLTARTWNDYFPLQVVYEWEDIIANELGLPLDTTSMQEVNKRSGGLIAKYTQKVVRRSFLSNYVDSSFNFLQRSYPNTTFLTFFLYPLPVNNHYYYSKNVIPILLDCFSDVVDRVPRYFRKCRALFVTNLEVYEYLKSSEIGSRLFYMPLSISDKYYTGELPAKDLDVLQMGRQNPVLHEWMLTITKEHPQVEYVYSALKDGVHNYYSTTKGWLGPIVTRADFMKFLGRAKVSLLSSPGIDGGEKRTGNFNPVTPRFFESAVNYCHMMGRYNPDGLDFKHCNVENVCKNYTDFDEFKTDIIRNSIGQFDSINQYNTFIEQHLTSKRAQTIKETILTL